MTTPRTPPGGILDGQPAQRPEAASQNRESEMPPAADRPPGKFALALAATAVASLKDPRVMIGSLGLRGRHDSYNTQSHVEHYVILPRFCGLVSVSRRNARFRKGLQYLKPRPVDPASPQRELHAARIVAFVFGLCIAIFGAVSILVPSASVWVAGLFSVPGAFYALAAVRITFGLILLSLASSSRVPKTLRVLGGVIVLLGITTAVLGLVGFEPARASIESWMRGHCGHPTDWHIHRGLRKFHCLCVRSLSPRGDTDLSRERNHALPETYPNT